MLRSEAERDSGELIASLQAAVAELERCVATVRGVSAKLEREQVSQKLWKTRHTLEIEELAARCVKLNEIVARRDFDDYTEVFFQEEDRRRAYQLGEEMQTEAQGLEGRRQLVRSGPWAESMTRREQWKTRHRGASTKLCPGIEGARSSRSRNGRSCTQWGWSAICCLTVSKRC